MKLAIALIIFSWVLVNTFDLPQQHPVPDNQALSFNWFKQWRKKPSIPEPKYIVTPEHRPNVTPEHKTITMPKARPIVTPEHKPATTTNLGQQFQLLESEVMVAKQNKKLFNSENDKR